MSDLKDIAEKVEEMKQQFSILLDVFLVLQQKYAILNPMLFSVDTVEEFGGKSRANGFNIVKNSLFYSCILDIHNIAKDKDSRTSSVRNFMKELTNEELVDYLREEFAKTAFHPVVSIGPEEVDFSFYQEKRYKENIATFNENYERLQTDWQSFSKSSQMRSFKTARNKLIAHVEVVESENGLSITDISELGLKWGDLKSTIMKLQNIMELLNCIVRNTSFAWQYYEEQLEKISSDYWTPFESET
jgi:hypothetical protein